MYARVLRKWSLKTNLMSYLWLAVVTMLLLIICAPTTTTTMAMAATSRTPTPPTTPTSTPSTETKETKQLQLAAPSSRSLWRDLITPAEASAAKAAQASATIPATNVGVVEESFYIPVATSQEEGDSHISLQQLQQQQQHNIVRSRLINISPSSSSSSSISSRSSNSKILSNSRLYSNSFHKQQQQQLQLQQPDQHTDDSLVYSYYYKAAAREASTAQQFATAADNVFDDVADDADDTKHDIEGDVEEEDEEDTDFEESAEHVADARAATPEAAATLYNNIFKIDKNKQVPNSQITNLYNKLTQTQPAARQQQLTAANVHSIKARRHVLQETYQQQQQQQQQQQHLMLKSTSFHSPVRETATKAAVVGETAVPSPAKNGSKNFTLLQPPFRYIIEAFEIPATLPYTTLTQQQQRMLLHQQQLAARSRRDSRPFGLNAGNSGYQQHYYNSQLQQQQPYQRLQQQLQHHNANSNINNNNNNNFNQKHHQSANNINHHLQQQNHHHHHNHHQQLHHNNHYQQHQRNKRRRYCSARDPAQLAFEAPTVFEGKIISMTPDRRANFSATVEVKEIFKQQIGFRLQKYLRLQFAYRNTSGECDIYREQLRSRGLVRGDELEQGRIYLLFVQQIDLGNFTILGQPIRKTRRVIEAVKNAVSENYAQLAAIRSITASNRTVENGKELRIVCKVQGRPPPKVTWFKDHKSINRNRRLYQIVPFKKRSELIIRSFNSSDAGRYECRAKNKVNRNLERRAIVIKAYPVPRYETHLTGGTGHSCPPDAAEFCFNGGTCKLFVEIGSYSCICPEGFIGERCDRKEVNNMPPNPTYKTGYIADDPNVYDAELTGATDMDANRTARFNRTAFSDDADDDIDEDESLEEN